MNEQPSNPVRRGMERGFLFVPVVSAAPTDSPTTTDGVVLLRAVISGATIVLYGYTPSTGWVSVTLS